jgi:hypothetical protein
MTSEVTEEYLAKLESLSFLEAVALRRKIDLQIAEWKACKASLKAVNELKLEDNINRELLRENTFREYKTNKTLQEFESQYDLVLDNLNKMAEALGKNNC